MFISRGTEVTTKMDYKDLKVGEKYIVASLDVLDDVVWLMGHMQPYPPVIFCEAGTKTEIKNKDRDTLDTLVEILELLKEINNKL